MKEVVVHASQTNLNKGAAHNVNYFRLGCLITLVAASAGTSCAQVHRFQIDAQYRGVVKKGFNSIGTTGLKFIPGTNGEFRCVGNGRVVHPKDKAQVFEFNVDMDFKLTGNKVEYLSARNSCAKGSEGLRAKVERLIPFLHLVAALPSSVEPRTISTPHGTYTMRESQTEHYTEITVQEGHDITGKFFLTREAGQLNLEKFRIPTSDNIVLTFVSANP